MKKLIFNMLNKNTKFLIAVFVQVIIIFLIIFFKVSILTGGTEVILRIEPVDPWDPLRGDYITFDYNISDIPYSNYYKYEMENFREGQTVYVLLEKSSNYWYAFRIQKTKPTNSNTVFIKGIVDNVSSQSYHITYGIEEYFIEEKSGRNFDFSDKEALAKVIVDENGNAVLKQVYIDDKPWP